MGSGGDKGRTSILATKHTASSVDLYHFKDNLLG
jgi:hypothetical protein